MDEMTLVREFADDAPLPGAARLADVRAKLMTEIAPRRRRRFRVVGMTSVGVAAAAAVALVVTLSGNPRGPDQATPPPPTVQTPQVLTAAAVLDYAAEAALTEQTVAPRPDQYIYLKVVTSRGYQEQWTAVDGKRPGLVLGTDPYAPIPSGPTRACGTTVASGGNCVFASHYWSANPRSTEETMRFVIDKYFHGAPVREENFFKPAIMMTANDLLSPALKAAVFKALKVTHVGGKGAVVDLHARDAAGREGIGLSWGGGSPAFIFDAKTFQLLGTRTAAQTGPKVVDHLKQR